jgi:methionyl-tRNA formyltransferase
MPKLRIIFMGSPAFALPCFKALTQTNHDIIGCYTQAAKPAHRGKKITNCPVAQYAITNKIPLFTPSTLNNPQTLSEFKNLAADLVVVAAYGLIIPENFLKLPKFGFINIHPSKLPNWRGAAPIIRTIQSGATETEICIIKMVKALDAGPIIAKEQVAIPATMTAGELHDIASEIGSDLVIKSINSLAAGEQLKAQPQKTIGLTYANKIQKTEAKLDFNETGQNLLNKIRAFNPYPAAYFIYQQEQLKIFKAEFIQQAHQHKIAEINLADFSIYVKDGILKPLILQRPGGKQISITDFLNQQNSKN